MTLREILYSPVIAVTVGATVVCVSFTVLAFNHPMPERAPCSGLNKRAEYICSFNLYKSESGTGVLPYEDCINAVAIYQELCEEASNDSLTD